MITVPILLYCTYFVYPLYLAQVDVAGLLETNISAIGVLLVVLVALVFDLGIVTKGRLTDSEAARAEAEKRADAAEARAEAERKEHTEVIIRAADEVREVKQGLENSREETRRLQGTVQTAITTQNTLLKQMAAVLVRAGIKPPPKEPENEWGS